MPDSVLTQAAEIERLDLAGLRARWRELCGSEPPRYSRTFLARRLIGRLQELAYGGLDEATRVRLRAALGEAGLDEDGRASARRRRDARRPVSGTCLVRDWQGRRCAVTVLADGFEYAGRKYRSLSAIARAITGTRWNGPAFFGLRGGQAG